LALAFFILAALILLFAAAGLGLVLDRKQSALMLWSKRALATVILSFGIFILLLPALSWRHLYLVPAAKKSSRPNLIMIVLDTVRSDHLSLYGYGRETTPFLDQLAEQSLVFDNAYSASPWTLSSHATFFTGLWPSEHNCTYENLRLDPQYTTLAETLESDGYFTIGWSNNPLLNYASGLTQGFDRFVENNQLALFFGDWLSKARLKRFPEYNQDNGAALTRRSLERWLPRLARGIDLFSCSSISWRPTRPTPETSWPTSSSPPPSRPWPNIPRPTGTFTIASANRTGV